MEVQSKYFRLRYFADVESFPALDGQADFGPTFELEYSARDTYGATIEWGADDPLNATWWHRVTEGSCDALCATLFLTICTSNGSKLNTRSGKLPSTVLTFWRY